MKTSFRLILLVALIAGLFAIPGSAGPVYAQKGGATVDLLVMFDGASRTVASQVETLGGAVKLAYKNAPVLAVSLPVKQVAALKALPGVVRIAKDQLVYLTQDVISNPFKDKPNAFEVQDASAVAIRSLDPTGFTPGARPQGYANYLYTGAVGIWDQTGYGAGTIVAVVDTGVTPNVCLSHAVIGAPGFPDGYNATGDGVPATSDTNHWHGTHVGGVIASACALDFSADPSHPIYQAVSAYLPYAADFVPVVGQAPMAQLYPVKVFPESGEGVPTSVILDGLDHVLSLKKGGLLDIDIVNMSLGGPTLYDGKDFFDLFIEQLVNADILVVTAAANSGPWPNSNGSPGTSLFSVTAGALDYAPSSRVLYEYLGLVYGLGSGQGLVMRPTTETRVANFSSRGPTSDGRGKPDISALGLWNFHAGPQNELRWAGGTSFASPTVAGVAALLNAHLESNLGQETQPVLLRNALLAGANRRVVGYHWRPFNDQGFGAVDAVAALKKMSDNDLDLVHHDHEGYPVYTGKLRPNILGSPRRGKSESFSSKKIRLGPSKSRDFVFRISNRTSKVTIEVYDIVAPDNSAYAFWPNALEFHVQSAKRSAIDPPVAAYWYPFAYGDSFTLEIEDGDWKLDGQPFGYQPMEPGLMKVSFIGDFSNESPVSFKVRITRENHAAPRLPNRISKGPIASGDVFVIPADIPAGTTRATFDLRWNRLWNRFPTSDVDLILFDPDGNLFSIDGATLNAPERAVIENPVAGTWYAMVIGYEVHKREVYKLFLNTE